MKNSRYDKAFTLVEILIVVAVVGIISAVALPNFFTSKTVTDRNACISNLGRVRSIVDMWALDTNAATDAQPQYSDLPTYIRPCPKCLNTSYVIPAIGANPTCPNGIPDHVLTSAGGDAEQGEHGSPL